MSIVNELLAKVSILNSKQKLELVDKILASITPVNKGVNSTWGKEAEERLSAQINGDILTIDEKDLFSKYQK